MIESNRKQHKFGGYILEYTINSSWTPISYLRSKIYRSPWGQSLPLGALGMQNLKFLKWDVYIRKTLSIFFPHICYLFQGLKLYWSVKCKLATWPGGSRVEIELPSLTSISGPKKWMSRLITSRDIPHPPTLSHIAHTWPYEGLKQHECKCSC